MTLRQALLTLLDQVDYTTGACGVAEPVGAVLPKGVITMCREALSAEVIAPEEGPPRRRPRLNPLE